MHKDTSLIVTGLLVFATPFWGVPLVWKDIALFVLGTLIVLIACLYRLDHRRSTRTSEQTLHLEHNPHAAADVRTI